MQYIAASSSFFQRRCEMIALFDAAAVVVVLFCIVKIFVWITDWIDGWNYGPTEQVKKNCSRCGRPYKGIELIRLHERNPKLATILYVCPDCVEEFSRLVVAEAKRFEAEKPRAIKCNLCCGTGKFKGYRCQACHGAGRFPYDWKSAARRDAYNELIKSPEWKDYDPHFPSAE